MRQLARLILILGLVAPLMALCHQAAWSKEPKLPIILRGHAEAVQCVAFSPDGKTLASESVETVKLWDVASGNELATIVIDNYTGLSTCLAFSPDGKTLAWAIGGWGPTAKLWNLTTKKEWASLRGHKDRVDCLAFSPDGKTLASGSSDATVRLWEVATGKERATFRGHTHIVKSVAFSPDGRLVASGSVDSAVKLWDATTGKEKATLKGHRFTVWSVAFSPDGKTLASGSLGDPGRLVDPGRPPSGDLKLWDVATAKERATIRAHEGDISSVVFSPDGRMLASGAGDDTIKLWDPVTGKERATLKGHAEPVECVAFSPDGKTLASASADRTVRLWDLIKLEATRSFGAKNAPLRPPEEIKEGLPQPVLLTARELEGLWADLARDDAARAYQSIWTMVSARKETTAFLKKHLQPVSSPDPQRIARLITDLSNDRSPIREKAMKELGKLGELAEPALRSTLGGKPSLDVRRRLERLLQKLEQPVTDPQQLRSLRAIEVLEHIGSAQARELLQCLAKGATEARLTQEARVSMERLAKRRTLLP